MQDRPNPNQLSARELYDDCIRERGCESLQRYVYSSARYLVDSHEDAEDITQNTLVKIYAKIETLEAPDTFKSWVQRVVHNEFIDWLRKEKKHFSQVLPPDLPYESNFGNVESSDEPIEQLLNVSKGKKTKWAWIGRYHYGLQDRDLASVESLLCEKSVHENTMFVARSKTKSRWIEEKWVDYLLEAKFQPIDPADTDPILQKLFQQLLLTENWDMLYKAPLDKGTRWAWIGRHIYEMSDEDLVRVENLLCNSSIQKSIMSIRRTKSRRILTEYLNGLQAST